MPIYEYQHPITKEIFEVLRPVSEYKKPYISEDGTECVRVMSGCHGWKADREVFEVDAEYVRKVKPKYIKFNDGHKERYDPTKHC